MQTPNPSHAKFTLKPQQRERSPVGGQFSKTPNFTSKHKAAGSNVESDVSTLARSVAYAPMRRQHLSLVKAESIDDLSQSQDEIDHGPMISGENDNDLEITEKSKHELEEGEGEGVILNRGNEAKRQRLSSPSERVSHSLPARAALQVGSASASMYRFRAPAQTSSLTETSHGHIARPIFLKPDVKEENPSVPLTDLFSPHRRGKKYVPGGIAETMRGWIVEISQEMQYDQKYGNRSLHYHDSMAIKIQETQRDNGQHFTLLSGESHGQKVNAVILGKGNHGSGERNEVIKDTTVALGRPRWEVRIGEADERWVIGVDWAIQNE